MAFAIEMEERFAAYNAQMCLVHARRVREQLRDDFVLSPPPPQTPPGALSPVAYVPLRGRTDKAALPAASLQEDAQLAREGSKACPHPC